MLGNIKQLGELMKNAGAIKERIEQVKNELERKTVTGESGGGAVTVTMTGKGRVVRIDLDQNMMAGLAGDDKTMVEELIAAAVNDAVEKVQKLVAAEIQNATGGLNLPGLEDMIGT